ncbi:hypothetical protein [Paracoccus spongiarum]|uniref:XRE family transcriptional regulator n=1 Tax=Paracoccus spongiarum TaxID=3064387 RepID=A0ABT9JFS3_9RHOB|nr:hypothetical protein [Paracoccus sp. 2205BS29-5]MDP5308680.1 hypothetical protein [Paracoccus sp. 2205BS29-5]
MPIYLRPALTQSLIEHLHGDIDDLVSAWEHLAETSSGFPSPRQRSTIYRWLKDGLPSRGEEVVALCALLNVDPLALFDYHRNGYFSNFAKIRVYLQRGLAAAGVFSPLYRLYRPGPRWPADDMALRCFGRDWFGAEFDNGDNWRTSDYVQVSARFLAPTNSFPRAVHIAYRRRNSPDTMWRFYGTVIAVGDRIELYSEGGAFQQMPRTEPSKINFRTYYGGRPVEWRVASLHDFELTTKFPCHDESVVSFVW